MQIPVFGESQVMQPGNPVPIGDVDTPMASALNKLGNAMEDLGKEMDKEQKKKREKIKQYNVNSALEDYERNMRTYNQVTLWNDPDARKDLTGLTARNKSIEFGESLKRDMIEGSSFDAEQAAMFDSGSKKIQNQLDPDLMLKSSQESEKDYRSSIQGNLFKMASAVANNPHEFEDRMAQVEIDVMGEFEAGTVRNMPQEIRDRQKTLTMGVYNQFRFNKNFTEAKKFLAMNQGLFSPEEVSKELNSLEADRSQHLNFTIAEEGRAERLHQKKLDELQAQKAVLLYENIEAAAANGTFAVDAAKQKVTLEMLRGSSGDGTGITLEAGKQLLLHQPSAQRNVDEAFVGNMLGRAFHSGNFDKALSETKKRFDEGKLSAPTYSKTVADLLQYKQFQRNRSTDRTWDISKEAYRTMMDYYKTIGKDPNALSTVEEKKKFQVMFGVLNDVKTQIEKGNQVNIGETMQRATKAFGAEYGAPAMHTPTGVQRPLGNIDDLKKTLRDKAIQIKNGNMSIEQRRAIQDDMKAINNQIKQRQDDEVKRGSDAGSGSTGTRSSRAVQRTR